MYISYIIHTYVLYVWYKTTSIFSNIQHRRLQLCLSIIPMTRTDDQWPKLLAPAPNHEVPQKSMLMILTVGVFPYSILSMPLFSLLAANSFSFSSLRPSLPPFIFAFNPFPSPASQITCRLHNMIRPPVSQIHFPCRDACSTFWFFWLLLTHPGWPSHPHDPQQHMDHHQNKTKISKNTTTFLCQKSRFFHCLTTNWYHSYHIPCVAMRLNFLLTYYCRLHETIPLT